MKSLSARYKKYNNGGLLSGMSKAEMATATGTAAAMVGSLADALGPADEYGKKSAASNILGSAGQMAAAGSAFGPIGTGVGAVVGAGIGVINNSQQKREANRLKLAERMALRQQQQSKLQADVAADPSLIRGNLGASYYAMGGELAQQPIENGQIKNLNSQAVSFEGPSHEQGGINLPGMNAQVEGKETANGTYVFSERLGFAQKHKPIAKAIGIIEKKTVSPERINSIKLLKHQENNLKLYQNYARQQLGLN